MSNQLMKHLPGYYRTSNVMKNTTEAEDREMQLFKARINNTLDQFFVSMADTSLDRWEQELGIPVNHSKPVEYRRSVIRSKLRGQGTVTKSLMKNVTESYSNGKVDIIENNFEYAFTIRFVDINGIPPNLEDLKIAIEEIKPAHLAVLYRFKYLIWDVFSQLTWNEAKGMIWDDFLNYE